MLSSEFFSTVSALYFFILLLLISLLLLLFVLVISLIEILLLLVLVSLFSSTVVEIVLNSLNSILLSRFNCVNFFLKPRCIIVEFINLILDVEAELSSRVFKVLLL